MHQLIKVINFVKMIEEYAKQMPPTIVECLKVW
jgi:hypothetical protein